MRRAFTLMELLIVMMILALLAGLTVAALSGTQEIARENRTKTIIGRCHSLIQAHYDNYKERRMPVRLGPGTNARLVARLRMDMLRETMRMELPCCRNDVLKGPVVLPSAPSIWNTYNRLVAGKPWDDTNVEAECLWLILTANRVADESQPLDTLAPSEVQDTDGDGVPEILDAWGRPLVFLRWAPGYTAQPGPDGAYGVAGVDDDGNGTADDIFEAGWPTSDDIVPATMQIRNGSMPDQFDPLNTDPRVDNVNFPTPADVQGLPRDHTFPIDVAMGFYPLNSDPNDDTFALRPLIVSSGRDKELGLRIPLNSTEIDYSLTAPPNDPYVGIGTSGVLYGAIVDWSKAADNITNHYVGDAP